MSINNKKFLDQEGLKFLWSKISMEDYPNNDTLIAVINAIDENKADRSELIDIDTTLTQSGQAADAQITGDRIKALDALAVKIEEQILTEEQKKQVRKNIGAGTPLPENIAANQVLTTNSESITVWEDKPFWSEEIYTLEVEQTLSSGALLGNPPPASASCLSAGLYKIILDDTDEYFHEKTNVGIITVGDDSYSQYPFYIKPMSGRPVIYFQDGQSHKVKIELITQQFHTMEEKFIPEEIARVTYVNDQINNHTHSWEVLEDKPFHKTLRNKVLVHSSSGFPGVASVTLSSSFGSAGDYQIVFNNVEYNCIIEIGTTEIGPQENFPFTLKKQRTGPSEYRWFFKCSDTNSTNNSLRIYQMSYQLVKLDEIFIPSTIARTENLIGQKYSTEKGEIFNDYENNVASGEYAHAEGYSTEATGSFTHAEGYSTKATTNSAHAEGLSTEASGSVSHSEGYKTKATAAAAHAEGNETIASGENSHAEGYSTKAIGENSHTEGLITEASGQCSHAEGTGTIAAGNSQHTEGEFNISDDTSTYIHIAGNGASSSNRSNAYTLDKYGNGWFSGDVYVDSTSGTNRDEGSKKLATEEYVIDAVSGGVKSWDDLEGKPFYETETQTTVVSETAYVATNVEGEYYAYLNLLENIVPGDTYIVKLNDEEHVIVADEYGALLIMEDYETAWRMDHLGNSYYYSVPQEGTISISHVTKTIKPIDEKFIPDNVKNQHVQADWKQTDETAMDFIKNKPFYDLEQKTILDKISITVDEDGYYDYGSSSPLYGIKVLQSFIPGIKYHLIFDDEIFEVTSRHEIFESEEDKVFYLGNGYLYDPRLEDTKEDIVVAVRSKFINGYTNISCVLFSSLPAKTYINSIIIPEQAVKIPDKYLKVIIPEVTASNQQLVTDMHGDVVWEERLGYKTIAEVTFLEESETYPQMANIHMHFGYTNAHEFIVGETYKVNFDGTLYECVATQTEDYGIALGNLSYVDSDIYEDTGEPFGCAYLEPGSTILFIIPTGTLDSYYTISVVGPAVVVQPIPGEYIAGGLYKGSSDNSFQMKETQANQIEAIALGNRTVANGRASIAIGVDTTTKGPYTIAEGQGTVATVPAQHVQGKYNIEDTEGKYAHIVGNGKRQYGVTTTSNAYTLNWDGTGWFANGIKTGGASQDDEDAETVVTAKNDPQPNQYLTTDVDGNKVWEDKLCYYNIEEVEIFKETSTDGAGGAQLTIENSCSTEEGVACIITFDGVEYVCYPYEIPNFNTVWGNPSLMGGAVDSGEPFCCSGLTTEMMSIIKFKEAIPHTFSAKSQKRIYQTIDPAYIPFNARSGEGENSVIIASEVGTASGFNAVSLNGAIATGTKATAVNVAFAEGDCSFSQGYMTHAEGYCSAALGGATIAYGNHQLTIGRGNIEDTNDKYALIVGNAPINEDGYVDREQASNAHTIDWDGNAWYQGAVESQGIILTDDVTGIKYRIHVSNGELTMSPLEVSE